MGRATLRKVLDEAIYACLVVTLSQSYAEEYLYDCVCTCELEFPACLLQETQTECNISGPLGLENRAVSNGQITSSSYYRDSYQGKLRPWKGRLNNADYWAAEQPNPSNPWIQVDFLTTVTMTAILMQGGAHDYIEEWVTMLQIQTGASENSLTYIMDENGPISFTANSDRHTTVKILFPKPITARYLRIRPTQWHEWCSLRFEMIGYRGDECRKVEFEEYITDSCSSIPSCSSQNRQKTDCESFKDCCWDDKWSTLPVLRCSKGPSDECASYSTPCSTSIASDCRCTYKDYDNNPSSSYFNTNNLLDGDDDDDTDDEEEEGQNVSLAFAVGVGVGEGVFVFLVVVIVGMIYCRIKGHKEGRKQGTQVRNANRKSDTDYEECAEIARDVHAGDRTIKGYNTSGEVTGGSTGTPVINSRYKSLIKPNQDMGTGDYMDPKKYTEPPVLPERNSVDEAEDDDDYVSQGTPASTRSASTKECVSSPGGLLKTTSEEYVNVTDSRLHKDLDTQQNDYVDLDEPSLSKSGSDTKLSSDYVDVDDPSSLSKRDSSLKLSSDYVDV